MLSAPFGDAFTVIPGGYVFQNESDQLEARSHDGAVLWQHGIGESYVSKLVSSADGTLYFATYGLIHAVTANGLELWTALPTPSMLQDTLSPVIWGFTIARMVPLQR